jgi:hypothetical protein
MMKDRSSESGSIIYWIFLAVALFAALSFTVANINRGGNTDMSELARLRATDVIQYSGAIQRGIRIMRIEGVDESEICFHTSLWGHNSYEFNPQCTLERNQVFNSEGGNIGFQESLEDWYVREITTPNDSGQWVFSSRYEVENVGTDSGGGGTVADNAELVMATAPLKRDICEQINLMLGHSSGPPTVPANTFDELATNEFVGTFSDGAGRIADYGRERCVSDASGYYMYYKVILVR